MLPALENRPSYNTRRNAIRKPGWPLSVPIVDSGGFKFEKIRDNNRDVLEINCTTSGLCYMPMVYFGQKASDLAYGVYQWSMYKGSSANQPAMGIMDAIRSPVVGGGGASGYGVYMNTGTLRRVIMTKVTTGTPSNLQYTNTNYVDASGTWYKFSMTRSKAGVFTTYMDDTALDLTGGFGTNPITDNTVTSVEYMVFDLDTGDKVRLLTGFGQSKDRA